MSDKIEAAVAALGDVVSLSAKVRIVRTVEGAKYFDAPIGSVIIADAAGNVLETLHKGNGSTAGTPSSASFANDPKVAKHGATLPGQSAFGKQTKSAFDSDMGPGKAATAQDVAKAQAAANKPTPAPGNKKTAGMPSPASSTTAPDGLPSTAKPTTFKWFAYDDQKVTAYLDGGPQGGSMGAEEYTVYDASGKSYGTVSGMMESKEGKKLYGNVAAFGKEKMWWSNTSSNGLPSSEQYGSRAAAVRDLLKMAGAKPEDLQPLPKTPAPGNKKTAGMPQSSAQTPAKVVSSFSEGSVAGAQKQKHLGELKSKLTHTNLIAGDDAVFSTAEVKVGNGTVGVLVTEGAKVSVKGNVAYVRHPNGGNTVVVGYRTTTNLATPGSPQKISYYKKFPEGAEQVALEWSPQEPADLQTLLDGVEKEQAAQADISSTNIPESAEKMSIAGQDVWVSKDEGPKNIDVYDESGNKLSSMSRQDHKSAWFGIDSSGAGFKAPVGSWENAIEQSLTPAPQEPKSAFDKALQSLKDAGLTDAEIDFADEIVTNVDESGLLDKSTWTNAQFGGLGVTITSKTQVPRPGNKAWDELLDVSSNSNLTETSARIRAAVAVLASAEAVTDDDGYLRRTKGKSVSESIDAIVEDVMSAAEASYTWFKDTGDSKFWKAHAKTSQKEQSDALQEAQDKADAESGVTIATAAEIERAKHSVMLTNKYNSNLYGGVSGDAAGPSRSVTAAFLAAVKSGEDRYAMATTMGWTMGDYKPANGYKVSPNGQVTEVPSGKKIKFGSAESSWSTILDQHTKPEKTDAQKADKAQAADSYVVTGIIGATNADVSKETVDTPKGPIEVHTTPGAEIFTTGTGAAVKHKSGAFPEGFSVKYNGSGAILLNTDVPASAKLVKTVADADDEAQPEAPTSAVPDAPQSAEAPTNAVPEGTWLLTSGGVQRAVPVGKKDTVWQGSHGLFVVEKPNGVAKQYSWNSDFWGTPVSGAMLEKQKSSGALKKVDSGEQPHVPDAPTEASATDNLNAVLLANTLGMSKEDFTPANVHVPNHGTMRVQVSPGSTAHGVGTGVVVTHNTPDGQKAVKYQAISGKVVVEDKPLPKSAVLLPLSIMGGDSPEDLPEAPTFVTNSGSTPTKSQVEKILKDTYGEDATILNRHSLDTLAAVETEGIPVNGSYYIKDDEKWRKEGSYAVVDDPALEEHLNAAASEVTANLIADAEAQQILDANGIDEAPEPVATKSDLDELLAKLQAAALDLSAAKDVKGSKYGNDSNGNKGWLFNTHLGPKGGAVYSDSDEWGNLYLYEVGGTEPISGPHAQVKEAKAWLATNGQTTDTAPEPSASLPEAHTVPNTAGGKTKPASVVQQEAKAVTDQPKAATPQAEAPTEGNYFSMGPTDGKAFVMHPKYGEIAVETDDGATVYTTGVGVVVKFADGSGSVTSGKTGKVEKFDVLPDNKLPVSSTVEVKQQTPSEAAEAALQTAVGNQSVKDIEDALAADAANPPLADWEKELMEVQGSPGPLGGVGTTPYVAVSSTTTMTQSLSNGSLPDWVKPSLESAEGVWAIESQSPNAKAGEWDLLYRKEGLYYRIPAAATAMTVYSSGDAGLKSVSEDEGDSWTSGLGGKAKDLLTNAEYGSDAPQWQSHVETLPDEIFASPKQNVSAILSSAISKGYLPDWLQPFLEDEAVDQVWLVPTMSDPNEYSLLARRPDGSYRFYTSDSDGGPTTESIEFDGEIAESWAEEISKGKFPMLWSAADADLGYTFPPKAAQDAPEPDPKVEVNPEIPDLPAAPDGPSVQAEHSVAPKPITGMWIKSSKAGMAEGETALLGVSDDEGNPVILTNGQKFNGYGYSKTWVSPWGEHDTLKEAKEAAAKYGTIDYSKVKDPNATVKKKVGGKNGVPNALGVPEVEWNGHRLPLYPGMRMFDFNGKLYLFKGSEGLAMTASGKRLHTNYTQKDIKDAGGEQIAYGGSAALGKFDFNSLIDPNGPSAESYDFSPSGLTTRANNLFLDGDLNGIGHLAAYLDSFDGYAKKTAQKRRQALEISALVLQNKATIEAGGFDGEKFARIDAALSENVDLTKSVRLEILAQRKEYLTRISASLGYDVGTAPDNLNIEQVKALAASRGFSLAPYMTTQKDAAVWLETEFTGAGFTHWSGRATLMSAAQHKKVLAEIAVGTKYEKYMASPVQASPAEKVTPVSAETTAEATETALASLGIAPSGLSKMHWMSQIEEMHKSGNLMLSLAFVENVVDSFGKMPEVSRKAFLARLTAHGPLATADSDVGGLGITGDMVRTAYTKIANAYESEIDIPYEPPFATLKEKYSEENLAALDLSKVSKPDGVDAPTWTMVLAALGHGDSVDEDILPPASEYGSGALPYQLNVPGPLLEDAPDTVKQLLAYGASAALSGQIKKALGAVAETGVWGKPWADTYQIPDGALLFLRPGDKVFYGTKNKTVVYNEFIPESSYSVVTNWGGQSQYGSMNAFSLAPLSNEKPVKEVPVNWDFDMAKGFVPQIDEQTYTDLMGALKVSYQSAVSAFPTGGSLKGESIIAVKNFMETADFSAAYPTLKEMGVAGVPDGALAALHYANIKNDPTVPQMLEVFAKYGYFAPQKKADAEVWADNLNLDPDATYFPVLVSSKDAEGLHDSLYKTNFLGFEEHVALASDLNGKKFTDISEVVEHYNATTYMDVSASMWQQLQGALGKVEESTKKDLDELVLSPTNKKLGGMHSKKVWVDQNGNEWMTKGFPNDPNGPYRVDMEHYANEISRLYGYNAPATRTMEVDGTYQYVQLLAPSSGEIGSQSLSSLPESVVVDAMSEHVIDWVLSNHDSHSGNLLKTPDGQHVYGIDKGQAGRFFGTDKLAEGYHASNPEPVWYDNVYAAIRTGQMDKETADAVRDAVLRRAAQVATRHEDRFQQLMTESQAKRDNYPAGYKNADAWVEAHNERRKAAFDDFMSLYKGLYKKAGYDWGDKNTLDDYLPKQIADRFHAAPSEELSTAVKAHGTLGVPLFYKTDTFADDSMLVYKTTGANGKDILRANATLLPDADKTLMDWLKGHTIEKVDTTSSPSTYEAPADDHVKMPMLDTSYNSLVAYAKTVNTHASDGNYTQQTVDVANSAHQNLKTLFDKVKEKTLGDVTALYSGDGATFITAEQQDTWLAHAARMLQQFEVVDEAKSQGVKVSAITDDTPFQMPAYKPSAGLDLSGSPKVMLAYKDPSSGVVYQKWSDGNYTAVLDTDETIKSDKGAFAKAVQIGTKVDLPKPPEPIATDVNGESVESVVSVANVPVSVSYQPASSFAKKSSNGFDVVEGKGKVGFTGHEYQIKVGDIVIKYQGLDDQSVARAQRGLARIEVKDWDGNPDALEKVNELLESVGLNMDNATEQSLEIGYYRRLAATSKRRKAEDKYKPLRDSSIPKTGDQAEVDAYRKLLEGVYGKATMKSFYDTKGYLPAMKEQVGGSVAGPVHWMRPDSSVQALRDFLPASAKENLYFHDFHDGAEAALSIGKTALVSTEDRMRVLGKWVTGQSSGPDQTQHGSSEYVYFRPPTYGYGSNQRAFLEPEYAMAGSNYGADHDAWGNTPKKQSLSPFDLQQQVKHSTTELLLKKGVSFYDGLALIQTDAATRAAIIEYYDGLGITEIRGIPVADRIVTTHEQAKKMSKKVWEMALAAEKEKKGL